MSLKTVTMFLLPGLGYSLAAPLLLSFTTEEVHGLVMSVFGIGSIVGSGLLGSATTHATDAFPLAADLGDIDGDGDLDWVTSGFSGDWVPFMNNGGGAFTFAQEFDAPLAASCALMLDFDNDGGLDLALIDELADLAILQHNGWYETFLPAGATPQRLGNEKSIKQLLPYWAS